jgi:hypothetical protein
MLGKIAIFRGKSFEKSFFSTNSTEFSAENYFPWKNMYEKLAPGKISHLLDLMLQTLLGTWQSASEMQKSPMRPNTVMVDTGVTGFWSQFYELVFARNWR